MTFTRSANDGITRRIFNVQVINRLGWDGSIRPPDQNELGWKDTVRMNPLENIVVAIQSNKQILPFPLPDSIRSLDVTVPNGVVSPAISGIDPATGNAITGGLGTVNAKVNSGQEYVWHCHILGHEENDMMRPMIFQVAPPAPSTFVAILAASGAVNLTWTDNAASESGFNLQRDTDPLFSAPVTVMSNANPSLPSSAFGGTITATDNPPALQAGQSFDYRLQSEDDFRPQSPLAGIFQTVPLFSAWVSTKAGIATVTTILAPPITYGQNGVVTVSVTSAAGTVTGSVTLSVDGGAPISQALSGGSAIFTLTTPAVGTHTLAASFLAQGAFAASSATGTLVVSPAPLTITASSATVPYGSAIPAITPNVVGLVPPDTPAILGPLVCSTTAIQGSPVGSYPTTCSGAANANYTITYVAGSVNITAVPLTITANNATRAVGAPNPAFTATYATFVNGDTSASLTGTLTCTTTATATSPAATYSITCSGQTSVNYTITYVPGTLTVTAAGPVLTLNPTALVFTSTPGVTTIAQTITVTNTGGAVLRITGITLAGANPFRFGMTQNCPINGAGLAAGGSCTISVTFTPNNNTNRSALVRVAVAAPAVTGTVTLNGITVRPVATLSTASLPFGLVPIDTTSAPQTVTLSNTGTVPLVLTSITIGGANAPRFAQTNTCPIGGAGLAANASCTISVTFRPNRRVARVATLTIRDNAPNSPQTVALTGTGQ